MISGTDQVIFFDAVTGIEIMKVPIIALEVKTEQKYLMGCYRKEYLKRGLSWNFKRTGELKDIDFSKKERKRE